MPRATIARRYLDLESNGDGAFMAYKIRTRDEHFVNDRQASILPDNLCEKPSGVFELKHRNFGDVPAAER